MTVPDRGHWVSAVGGTRTVPPPDPIAREYLLLALRLDHLIPGLSDGYFGPAELKADADMGRLRSPAGLRDDAAAVRERLTSEVAEPDRRAWLDAQLVALETQAAALAGESAASLFGPPCCRVVANGRSRDLSGPSPGACLEGGEPGRWSRPAGDFDPPDQHA